MQEEPRRHKGVRLFAYIVACTIAGCLLPGCATTFDMWNTWTVRELKTKTAKEGCGPVLAAYCDERFDRLSIKYRISGKHEKDPDEDVWMNVKTSSFVHGSRAKNLRGNYKHIGFLDYWVGEELLPPQQKRIVKENVNQQNNEPNEFRSDRCIEVCVTDKCISKKPKWDFKTMHPITPYVIGPDNKIQNDNPGALGVLMFTLDHKVLTPEMADELERAEEYYSGKIKYYVCFTVPFPNDFEYPTGVVALWFPYEQSHNGVAMAATPFTIVADIVTLPIQFLAMSIWAVGGAH